MRGDVRLISSARRICVKIGTGHELEFLPCWCEHRHTGHIRREQIRCELQSTKARVDRLRDRAGEHGLAESRRILDEKMSFSEQSRQRKFHDLVFADDDAADVVEQALESGLQVGNSGG